jgi:hypothetical protein
MNIAHRMTIAGLLKPESAWEGETSPVSASATRTNNAVKSMGIRPVANKRAAITMMMAKMTISGSIGALRDERSSLDEIILNNYATQFIDHGFLILDKPI